MYKRINITLPESTVRLMERVANKGERSRARRRSSEISSRGYEEESQKEDQGRILAQI